MNKDIIPAQVRNISYDEIKRLIEDFQKIKTPDAISPESLGVLLKLILQYPNEVVWDNDDIWEFINQVNTDLTGDIDRVGNDLAKEIQDRNTACAQIYSDMQQGDQGTYNSVKNNLFDPLKELVEDNRSDIGRISRDLEAEVTNRLTDVNRLTGDISQGDSATLDNAKVYAASVAEAVEARLNAALKRLIGGVTDVTEAIDTFNEIEAFLAGLTNSESLVEMLRKLKRDVLSEVDDAYQPKGEYLTAEDIKGKVDKEDGMGLSSNDFTDSDKQKLDSLPSVTLLQDIATSRGEGKGLSSNDFTNAYKTKLQNLPTNQELQDMLDEKVDNVEGKGLSTNDYTDEDKAKLDGLPSSLELSQSITQLSNAIADKQPAGDYLTEHQSLENYYSKTEADQKFCKLWKGTAEQYQAIANKDDSTLYIVIAQSTQS